MLPRALSVLILILAGAARWPSGAAISVWIDPHNAPPNASALVVRAMKTWTDAADGRFTLETSATKDAASIRVYFVGSESNYGETLPRIDRCTGAIVAADVVISADIVAAQTEGRRGGWAGTPGAPLPLFAARSGSGKPLAAFFAAGDDLFKEGLRGPRPDQARIVYVSPLKALGADIHKNLAEPRRG